AGHVVLAPVHVSATSQTPAVGRQTAPALPAGCWHVTLVPSHWSSVQGLLSAVQAVPLAFFTSGGQVALVPVHTSATSHSPAAADPEDTRGATLAVGGIRVSAPVADDARVTEAERAAVAGDRHVRVAGHAARVGRPVAVAGIGGPTQGADARGRDVEAVTTHG